MNTPSYVAAQSYLGSSKDKTDMSQQSSQWPTAPVAAQDWRQEPAESQVTNGMQPQPKQCNSPRTAADWANDQDQFKDLPALPEGWIRVKSRGTGEIYFCCTATGETTFEEPDANQAINQNNGLPPGWVEMTSKSTGKTYYWSTILQKSQFEKPQPLSGQIGYSLQAQANTPLPAPNGTSPVSPGEAVEEAGLPPGWATVVSRTTGEKYYYHAKSQTSQFERPTQ